jgi:hypothetical protein
MDLLPITERRFERHADPEGARRGYALAGDARPGDVLALAGGTLVRDLNENGLIDGHDARLRGRYVDVRV